MTKEIERVEEALNNLGRSPSDGGVPWAELSVEEQNGIIHSARKALRLEKSELVEAAEELVEHFGDGVAWGLLVPLQRTQEALKKYKESGK